VDRATPAGVTGARPPGGRPIRLLCQDVRAMRIPVKHFRVREGDKVRLKDWPTRAKPFYKSKDDYRALLAQQKEALSEQQTRLYADDRYSLLIIFQSLDAAGKDGAIKHVMSGVNPQGCQVFSFKHPSAEELDHDFLWRTSRCLPERGRIGIFNRSYYEEVLIVRVHPEILAAQRLPPDTISDDDFWQHRYRSITDLEKHLHRNGTRIVKIYLHLSKDEQRRRFLARIDDPDKNWKFSVGDVKERERWKDYIEAYEACLGATSTTRAPWYVVPADDKANARLIIAEVLVETLKDLDLKYPKTSAGRRKELQAMRKLLSART
jgi:PPK2 family polyphosphate:nucleotide phosphotransferase